MPQRPKAFSYGTTKTRQAKPRDIRPPASQRGYGTAHRSWRHQVLINHPVCRRCEMQDTITPATIAHHLVEVTVDQNLSLDLSNGVGVCQACHHAIHQIHGEVEHFVKAWAARGHQPKQPSRNQ